MVRPKAKQAIGRPEASTSKPELEDPEPLAISTLLKVMDDSSEESTASGAPSDIPTSPELPKCGTPSTPSQTPQGQGLLLLPTTSSKSASLLSLTIDTDAATSPTAGAGLPSVGSEGHADGSCNPCCFHPRGRCANGALCEFCHLAHDKRRRARRRRGESNPTSPSSLSIDVDAPVHGLDGDESGQFPMTSTSAATVEALDAGSVPGTPAGAPPPPPDYAAPMVVSPGVPPAPALPPGVPEPPGAPPCLLPAVAMPTSTGWPRTAPPGVAPPTAADPAVGAPWPKTMPPSNPPPGVVLSTEPLPQASLSPMGTPTVNATIGWHTPKQLPPGLNQAAARHGTAPSPVLPPGTTEVDGFPVAVLMELLEGGPEVPPLPPSGCYGRMILSSALVQSVGAVAGAAEAATRELGSRPAKVQLPTFLCNGDAKLFEHDVSTPAKVVCV